ncbi:CDP-alcohol phosphatidyltransferase family protein [Intrasporangium sp. YIM S08009]|uniref:CDP-alcohol phosphatidyltransferase family protein n=1 Tax=Intrasporangium zincisolvens TaxID=3080018 RepID=UPI002B056452|nr:CDP-alcohol phosphatidyltransferase family protein [Intrasporangium sp. YIM S08009]
MVHRGPAVGLATSVALVLALTVGVGVGPAGLVVGFACAAVLLVLVTVGLAASGRLAPGPADGVTLARAVLTCGVAALVVDAAVSHVDGGAGTRTAALVVLASVGLTLDAVDGRVARRTGTVSAFGARFDMESDAVLILVLAVHVARDLGWWVLVVGAARYLLLAAQRFAPWLRRGVPARRWRKAVAAYQGVGLTAAASGLLQPAVAVGVVGLGLAALAVSFGTEAATLWRLRVAIATTAADRVTAPESTTAARPVAVTSGRAVIVTMADARVLIAQRRSG